jgi:hypothetical protein
MWLTFLLALAAIVQPLTASAQEKPCLNFECRAQGAFRTCDRPRDGAKILSARVLAVSRECSKHIVSLQVEDGANSLPTVVEIDLGPCIYFDGKVGDVIQIALLERHSPDVRRYHLACRIW